MSEKPLAVFDIDGVLADVAHRLHYIKNKPKNWKMFFRTAVDDKPLKEGFELLKELESEHDIVFLTGRPEQCRRDTITWLEANGLTVNELHMRPQGNFGRSADTKTQLLLDLAAQGREIAVVVDDDVTVVESYRRNGFNVVHATWADEDEAMKRAQQVEGRF